MHLRLSRTTRNGTVYEYAQLVESVRRADGVPTHRVIGTLGALSPLEVGNLRAALGASRERKRVVVAPYASNRLAAPDVVANLRYLDIAVCLGLWQTWGLDELLAGLLPQGGAEVAPSKMVAALVMQRLIDPDSKLAATAWFPRTALPELLDVSPTQFNNTRVHRVLEGLESASDDLMAKLPGRYQDREGAFSALFLDVSDAAFVGQGPSMAQKGKTKEGVVARKIGIVLLCNPRGYPLRWQVVPGAAHDSKTMLGMLESIAGLRWLGEAPIVCDRAMGKSATVMSLLKLKLRFLTALTTPEFSSYGGERLPCAALAGLRPSSSSDAKVEDEALRRVTEAGMEQVDDNLFTLDLGLVERPLETPDAAVPTGAATAATPIRAMALCRRMHDLVASNECRSFEEARRQVQLAKGVAGKYRGLQRLVAQIQQQVLTGLAEHCSLDDLLRLAHLDADEQLRQFEVLVAQSPARNKRSRATALPPAPAQITSTVKLRVVAYFNQERFVDKRHRASCLLAEIEDFIVDLNRRLALSGSRRSRASITAEVDRQLRSHDLIECFAVRLDEQSVAGRTRFRVELTLDQDEWQRRRRYDGFTLLVAHPDLPHTAAQLCRLYRAKDAVEKDFHIIKSVVEIRPVRHHSDDKVRAHVTLCMLALLLERTLAAQLRGHCSAEVALTRLEPCRLNRFADTTRAYGLTRPTVEQKEILRQLTMHNLVDDELVAETLHPR